MHLTYEQGNRFYKVIDALITFSAVRFGLCDPIEALRLPMDEDLDELRSQALERLWADPAALEEFLACPPAGHTLADRKVAAGFRDRWTGTALLVGFDVMGRALFSADGQTVAVCGLSCGLSKGFASRLPLALGVTLLPFDGLVVYDSSIVEYPVFYGAAMRQLVNGEAVEAISRSPILDAEEFVRFARAAAVRRAAEGSPDGHAVEGIFAGGTGEGLLASKVAEKATSSSDVVDGCASGVHVGALAGLDERERSKVVRKELAANASAGRSAWRFDAAIAKGTPAPTLEEALALETKLRLMALARDLGIARVSKLRKAEAVPTLATRLIVDRQYLNHCLESMPADEFEALTALAESPTGRMTFSAGEVDDGRLVPAPSFPWSKLYRDADSVTLAVTGDVLGMLREVDFNLLRGRRASVARARRLAEAFVELCGVVTLTDFASNWSEFGDADISAEEAFDAASHVPYDLEEGVRPWQDGISGERCLVDWRLDGFDSDILYLLGCHERMASLGRCPLGPVLGERGVAAWKAGLQETRLLRNWLDAHVPDGENDVLFADRMIERLIAIHLDCVEPSEFLDAASKAGLFELSTSSDGVLGLLVGLYNALPLWENNGWSPHAVLEVAR